MEPNIILAGRDLRKQFYGNTVLSGVSIECKQGNVLAIVGENGAGKSTLMNIISGGLQPDGGTLEYEGGMVHFASSRDSWKRGIAFVHQELSLFDELTVGENIMLGLEPRRYGLIRQAEIHTRADKTLGELRFNVKSSAMAADLSPAERQMVEIAKAWVSSPRVLILDEPTSSLNKAETDNLFRFIREAKKKGLSVILITHRMDEIFAICDEAIVLKDGSLVFTEKTENTSKDELISKMVGREVSNAFPERRAGSSAPEAFIEIKDASLGNRLRDISIDLPRGVVVGIGGLEGQGQRELARALFGAAPFASGDYLINGKKRKIKTPADAIRNRIGFVPDDRKQDGLALPLSVRQNMTLLVLKELSKNHAINRGAQEQSVSEGVKSLNIKLASFEQPVHFLSGGNQQKIIFAKWVKARPELLVLHEPTRGVDVAAKLEIYTLIRNLANNGVSILLVTSDMLELIGMSDIIHVMYEGRIAGSIAGAEATEEKIMQLASGQGQRDAGGR